MNNRTKLFAFTYTFILLVLLLTQACDRIKCRLEKKVVQNVSVLVSNAFDCDDTDAVQESIQWVADQLKICASDNKRGVICAALAELAFEKLAPKLLPPEWHCRPDSQNAKFKELVMTACQSIPL